MNSDAARKHRNHAPLRAELLGENHGLIHDAFISYRSADGGRFARRLSQKLLRYRLPPSLQQDGPQRRLGVYLDTIQERATSDF